MKEGYNFEGWYLDKDFKYTMNLTTMPARNIVLYAKWTEVVEVDAGVIIAIVVCSSVVVLGLAYIAMACFCSACAFHSVFGKMNIFNYFECGKSLLAKVNKDQDFDIALNSFCTEEVNAPSAPPTYD